MTTTIFLETRRRLLRASLHEDWSRRNDTRSPSVERLQRSSVEPRGAESGLASTYSSEPIVPIFSAITTMTATMKQLLTTGAALLLLLDNSSITATAVRLVDVTLQPSVGASEEGFRCSSSANGNATTATAATANNIKALAEQCMLDNGECTTNSEPSLGFASVECIPRTALAATGMSDTVVLKGGIFSDNGQDSTTEFCLTAVMKVLQSSECLMLFETASQIVGWTSISYSTSEEEEEDSDTAPPPMELSSAVPTKAPFIFLIPKKPQPEPTSAPMLIVEPTRAPTTEITNTPTLAPIAETVEQGPVATADATVTEPPSTSDPASSRNADRGVVVAALVGAITVVLTLIGLLCFLHKRNTDKLEKSGADGLQKGKQHTDTSETSTDEEAQQEAAIKRGDVVIHTMEAIDVFPGDDFLFSGHGTKTTTTTTEAARKYDDRRIQALRPMPKQKSTRTALTENSSRSSAGHHRGFSDDSHDIHVLPQETEIVTFSYQHPQQRSQELIPEESSLESGSSWSFSSGDGQDSSMYTTEDCADSTTDYCDTTVDHESACITKNSSNNSGIDWTQDFQETSASCERDSASDSSVSSMTSTGYHADKKRNQRNFVKWVQNSKLLPESVKATVLASALQEGIITEHSSVIREGKKVDIL